VGSLAELEVRGLIKRFGDQAAVDDVSFTVREGEWFSILGPSGCGKTTTLRLIAGFTMPDRGQILIDGRDVSGLDPSQRGIGMVFQGLALFPHMTVFRNVSFGLELRHLDRTETARRVDAILHLVGLGGYQSRMPNQLSGGEQQRVAVARALAIEPAILLLDEPLSSLDAKLREELRQQLSDLQRRLAITTVYITHDQSEALSMSDRIAIMSRGRLEQVGTPQSLYESPRTGFVVNFLGASNILEGTLESERGARGGAGQPVFAATCGLRLPVLAEALTPGPGITRVYVRPERIALSGREAAQTARPELGVAFAGRVRRRAYVGPWTRYFVTPLLGGARLATSVKADGGSQEGLPDLAVDVQNVSSGSLFEPGDEVRVFVPADAVRPFAGEVGAVG